MIPNTLAHAEKARAAGRAIVGILCESTPRELVMATGGEPVCLCGGSAETAIRAEEVLPGNLCPLVKSTFGYHLGGSNPFVEMADLARESRPDCVIELIWLACLTYDLETVRVKRYVEETLGLPYLRVETDYGPTDSARIAVRIEALYETARSRRSDR
jgi:benzoyl-CoA reductase/2-hydroxyglutaryl-CoA dehydratase subunit BcrC/BadD/HgdB